MKRFLIMASLGLVFLLIVIGFLLYTSVLGPATLNREPVEIYIPTGSEVEDVADSLMSNHVLGEANTFLKVAMFKDYPPKVRSGHYLIPPRSSVNRLVNMFRAGLQDPVNMTIHQAQTVEEVAGKAARSVEPDSASILSALTKEEFLAEHSIRRDLLNAYLIPNTYEVWWNSTAEEIAERFMEEYHRFWNADRLSKARELGLTPLEVTTLASIVESETAKWEEMPTVAGLYLNRVRRGWKLQSDPTVIYALKRKGLFEEGRRRVLYKDLEVDDPYNTYKFAGIPPGPIRVTHPKAIDAVLNSPRHNYMYMCADPSRPGFHNFAVNETQHAKNKALYTRWLRENQIFQ
ncbi:MAG: endolytic transglycosylase MltG [Bacteroidota bacterium]|nr:endolytic transglycosylase MltG [Bacteroidota bacterium]